MKKIFFVLTICFSGFLLNSCGTSAVDTFTDQRIIAINADGSPHKYPVKNNDKTIPANEYNYSNHVAEIIESIKKSGRTNILIFVYGGMNSLKETIKKSAILAHDISETSDYYPVMVNWQSSLFDAYFEHLIWIRRGNRSIYLGPPLVPFYLFADLGRAITRLPINLVYQSIGIAEDYDFKPEINENVIASLDEMKLQVSVGKDYTGFWNKAARGVVYSCGFPIRLITTPLIDAGGKSAWDIMLRRTRMAFQKQANGKLNISFSPPDGAMSIFMDALANLYEHDNKYFFTLIGHSLGPVMLNELIRQYPQLPYRDIVYLAPSCTIRDAEYALNPYMLNHTNTTFYNLCLHENADKYSMMWYAGIPRGSILEWIDTFLGDPLTSDDLTLGKWSNSLRVLRSINPEFRKHIVIKAFGINDPETNTILIDEPETHTDFSNPKLRFWEPSFWQVTPLTKKTEEKNEK